MRFVLALLPLVLFPACTRYSIPTIHTGASIALDASRFEVGADLTGRHSGFTIFPFTLTGWCRANAIDMATQMASKSAYDDGQVDFLLQPRAKIDDKNFLLFQIVEVELQGKSIRIKPN